MEYLTTEETANFLKISTWTLYRYVRLKEIPFSKPRGRLIFNRQKLETWVDESEEKSILILKKNFKNIIKDLTQQPLSAINSLEEETVMAKTKSKSRYSFPYGSIYQRRKNGRWTIDYYKDGKRFQEVIKNATCWQDAHDALFLKKFDKQNEVETKMKPTTFRDYAEIFMRNYSMPNKKSWKCDSYALEAHLKPFFGKFILNDITPLLIEKFRSEKLKAGLKRTSTNRLLALLKKMFSTAMTWNFADNNPVKAVKFFSEKDSIKERILKESEELKLLAESTDHLKLIISTALNTGMRKGEILALTWNQIDLRQRLIKVIKTKSGEDREIPINNVLFELLKGLKKNSDYVFINSKTSKPFKSVQHSFKNACHRAGIKNMRFHDLRHSFASRLIQKGCDIETLRAILGHYSITVTERYIHTDRDQKQKAVNLLSKVKKELKTYDFGDKFGDKIQDDARISLFSVN